MAAAAKYDHLVGTFFLFFLGPERERLSRVGHEFSRPQRANTLVFLAGRGSEQLFFIYLLDYLFD